PLEHLRFFCTGEGSQELFNLLQRMHGPISLPEVKVTVVAPVYHPSALEGITTRWMPNAQAHLPGGRGELRTLESLRARWVRCSARFGVPCLRITSVAHCQCWQNVTVQARVHSPRLTKLHEPLVDPVDRNGLDSSLDIRSILWESV